VIVSSGETVQLPRSIGDRQSFAETPARIEKLEDPAKKAQPFLATADWQQN
jgi:hypothetical protein